MNCAYCRTPITQDRFALVELYLDRDQNDLCPKAAPRTCPECRGTGDTAPAGDPTPDAFDHCSYCQGAKTVRVHWPVAT
jgi:hypothetical protein